MKRRIRLIFGLMTLCIIGINGFQAYWLYTTWGLTHQQFARDAREALFVVGQREQNDFSRYLERELERRPEPSPKSVRATVVNELDYSYPAPSASSRAAKANITLRQFKTDTAHLIGLSYLNTIARQWPLDLRQLTRRFRAELRLRGADTPFYLDTLHLEAIEQEHLSDSVQLELSFDTAGAAVPKVRLYAFATPTTPARSAALDSLKQHLHQRASRIRPSAPTLTQTGFQTAPVPLLLMRDLYVQATFPAPTFLVLRRMAGLLVGSELLLALTTGCFLLMLQTILRQKKLSDVKNDFINNMTHELKTPLATVSAAVEALQRFGALQDPARTAQYLAISRQEVQRLSDLVEKVLQMATEERRELTLHAEIVRPADLIGALVTRHQLQPPKPIVFEVAVSAAETVRVDPLHLGNAINNLIDNAIKYSGERVRIILRSRRDPEGWHLTVADDGPGIPRPYQAAVFERFFRIPTGNLHSVKGFGLGLYYVRQVIERHGGRISVSSEPGKGAAFTISLPG